MRPGRGYIVRPIVPELNVMSVTSTHTTDGVGAAVAADDVEDVDLGAALDVGGPSAVEVAGHVERRVVQLPRLQL